MVVVVFRSRLRDGDTEAFQRLADRMHALAASMPGFISYKVYSAEDGERVSIHEWETPEHLRTGRPRRWGAESSIRIIRCMSARTRGSRGFRGREGRRASGRQESRPAD
jgi:hypothetical protein